MVGALRTGGLTATDGVSGTVGEGLVGTYGTLTLNADGSYSYAATASAVEALAAGTTVNDTFTYTITDGDQTSSAELVITVTGVNDAAGFDIQATDNSVTRDAQFDSTSSGQILITDPDASESVLASVTANFGTVVVHEETGVWSYTLDSTNEVITALNDPETIQDTITFTSFDGSTDSVSITVFTANLPAAITLSLAESSQILTAGDQTSDTLSGTVGLTDNEGAVLLPIAATYGVVAESEGEWSYQLTNSDVDVLGLDEGEQPLIDTIIFQTDDAQDIDGDGKFLDIDTDLDGSFDLIEGRQEVTVTIVGVNDAPVLVSQTIFSDQNDATLEADQTLFSQTDDPDNADGSISDTLVLVGVRTGALGSADGVIGTVGEGLLGTYGTLTLSSDGSYFYQSNDGAQDGALENAISVQDIFTFQVSDGTVETEAELIIEINNVAPVSVSGDITYEVLSLTAPYFSVNYTDFDDLTLSYEDLSGGLPVGLTVLAAENESGGELSVSGSTPSEITFFPTALTSAAGDYLLEATVSDGDNPDLVDRFVLSLRSEELLQTNNAIYEYISGESDYAVAFVGSDTTGSIFFNLWEPQESEDRIVVLRDPASSSASTLVVYSTNGATLEVRGAQTLNLQDSPGADVITLTGSVSGLSFSGVGSSDTLINETLILASPGTLALSLQNEGTLQLTSSGDGSYDSFNNSEDGVVGTTLGTELSFGSTTQSQTGSILLTPDNDPAAPYLVLASLASEGAISVSGYSGGSISQPSLLEISSADVPGAMSQSATATALITSGGQLSAGSLDNAGRITLRYDLHDQGLGTGLASGVGAGAAGHLEVTGVYTESGLLISDARSANGSSGALADVNEVSVGSMVLTGQIRLDADLLFSNTDQSLDWREGTVSFAPDVELRVAGGTLTLSANSTVTGYGTIVFGSGVLPDASSGATLLIDGSLATSEFEADFDFSDDAVTISSVNASDVLTLSASDSFEFDNETVNASLQVDGSLIVAGSSNSLAGVTSISTSGDLSLEADASATATVQLSVTQSLTNQGQIEINIKAPAQSDSNSAPSLNSGSWAGGVATITTSSAHGLTTGDVITLESAAPSGYAYSGPVTVVDATSFTYNLPDDPGGPASGGVIQAFANVLVLEGGLVNSGAFTVQQVGSDDIDESVYDHETVLISGDLTNTVDGILTFSDGNIRIDGDITNAGRIVIDAEASSAGSNGAGASVSLNGDLILASSSQLQLEIQDGGAFYGLTFPYFSTGIIRGTDANPADLGALVLSFDDSSDMTTSSDTRIIDLGYSDNFSAGAQFSAVSSNLAAGYSVSLQSNTYGTDTSRQTISVVVADDMGYESIASSEISTSEIPADFLDASNWSKVFPQSDVRDITWSDASGSGIATLVTHGPHGLTSGSQVDIFGTGGFDQSAAVVTVIDSTTVTYALASNPGSFAGGGTVTDYSSPTIEVASATYSSETSLATVVTTSAHGLQTGDNAAISGISSEYDYSGMVTVVDATTLTYSPISPPSSSSDIGPGGQIYGYNNPPGADDDVRVTHSLSIAAGSTVSLNSLSLEAAVEGTSTTTTNVGSLITLDDLSETTTSTTRIFLADQSAVGRDASLYVGNLGSNDSVVLTLGGLLTVNGVLDVSSNTTLDRVAESQGSIVVSESGTAFVQGGVNLNVDLSVERGGTLSWSSLYGSEGAIEGAGSIFNAGDLELILYSDKSLMLSVDLTNHGELDLQFGSSSTGVVSLTEDAGVTLTNEGELIASSFSTSGELVLNNNSLDSRNGDLLLFVDPGTSSSTNLMTLTGGTSAESPGILMLENTVFAASGTNTTGTAELNLGGYLELRLTGSVDFEGENATHDLILDGSSMDGIVLSNGGAETASWINSETIRFNNLTVDAGVILANGPNDDLGLGSAVIEITGVSVINGEFYNLSNGPDSSLGSQLYIQGSLTFNGEVIQEAGADVYIGSLASGAATVATSITFTNDFSNAGNVTVGLSGISEAHSIIVGSSTSAGYFNNSGGFAARSFSGTTTLDAQLNNTGDVLIQSQFVLDATDNANHVSSGFISLLGNKAGLTLGGSGGSDVLTITSDGYLVTSNSGSGIEIDVLSGASLVIDGYLGIGDTVENSEPGNISLATGVDDLTITTESELTIGTGAVVAMDVTFGASPLADSLTVNTAATGGVLRLSGGRLALSSVYSSAVSSATIIAATSILGSFDTVDGLILNTSSGRTVVDIIQTGSAITLTPLDPVAVTEGSSTGDVYDFSELSIAHYLAGAGDDLILNIGEADTAYGELGNDTFVLTVAPSNVQRVDGGAGVDRVVLPNAETAFDFTTEGGWLGHTFERIELLSMDDTVSQTLAIDAKGIKSIVDGQSDLLDGDVGLAIDGNAGDVINLSGDFEFSEDRFLLTHSASASGSTTALVYQPELFTGVSDGSVSLFFDQSVMVNVTHSSLGVSRYGDEADNTLNGTDSAGETLAGRAGDDVLDGKSGADRQLGGDGNDSMVFDSADIQTDGGNGVDTLMVSGSIDFSQLTNPVTNIEQLNGAGNGTADLLTLTFSDVFDLVSDNSLSAYVTDHSDHAEHKVLVINGDNEDTLVLEGVDVRDTTPIASGIDLFGDGNLYALFQDTTLGVDIYVLSSLLESTDSSGSNVANPMMGSGNAGADLYEAPQDSFGGF